jgi:uncharacterized protein (TIGR03437 family)
MILTGKVHCLHQHLKHSVLVRIGFLVLLLISPAFQLNQIGGAGIFGTVAAQTPNVDGEEELMIKFINEYRAQKGLSQLKPSISLTRAAEWMSLDMSAKNYFNHVDSLGRDPFVRMNAFGYGYPATKGENIAAGYIDAVRTFNQWKNSAGHNATMLNPNFNVIGIARAYNAGSIYKWYWTTDFGSFVDATIGTANSTVPNARTVNAANYFQTISPDAIAATFGDQLAQSTVNATNFPLPMLLGGVTVTVNDIVAQMLYVSPAQINYIVPANVDPGTAMVKVIYNGNVVAGGTVGVETVSPSIFTVTSNGQGIAAAHTTYNGVSFQPVANADGSARQITVGTVATPNFLVLYGTGLRRRSQMSNVRVTIGGLNAQVDYLGAHRTLAGLDQLNVRLPLELRGRGLVDVVVTIDGRVSNIAKINIGS